jgi:hypothetical protein
MRSIDRSIDPYVRTYQSGPETDEDEYDSAARQRELTVKNDDKTMSPWSTEMLPTVKSIQTVSIEYPTICSLSDDGKTTDATRIKQSSFLQTHASHNPRTEQTPPTAPFKAACQYRRLRRVSNRQKGKFLG